MQVVNKPIILFVDDEQNLLDEIKRHLEKDFNVLTACNGPKGIELLEEIGPVPVVVSDMKMPIMNGARFLQIVKEKHPHTVTMLLMRQSDIEAAFTAINQGHIFRFLTKPCPLNHLVQALNAALQQYDLVQSQRVLLEQTLHGSIKALTEILSLTNPVAFGRTHRIKALVSEFLNAYDTPDRWSIEVAAMLSQIGYVTLPEDIAEKVYNGIALTPDERKLVRKLPDVTDGLLINIPRIESIREMLRYQYKEFDGKGFPDDLIAGEYLPLGARILKICHDYDTIISELSFISQTLDRMKSKRGTYDPELFELFAELKMGMNEVSNVQHIDPDRIAIGMIFADDLRAESGQLLIARGAEVTHSIVGRVRRWWKSGELVGELAMIVPNPVLDEEEAEELF